jgi:uncharacterized Zn-binding protein involved in type VI secretion
MERYTVTLGASTTAGGKVISASSHGSINGAKIALENDAIFCPACRSQGKILCVGPRIPETWNGKQVALENDLCICGCFPSPRLRANQTLRSQVIDQRGKATSAVKSEQSQVREASNASASSDENYDLVFLITDENTGLPAVDWPYVIELANGGQLKGKTDQEGKTAKVTSTFADDAILRIFEPKPTPINPHWDR